MENSGNAKKSPQHESEEPWRCERGKTSNPVSEWKRRQDKHAEPRRKEKGKIQLLNTRAKKLQPAHGN